MPVPLLVLVIGPAGHGQVDDGRRREFPARCAGARPRLGDERAASLSGAPGVARRHGTAGHRGVGWSILWALARAELRRGRPVVLDGVARAPEVVDTRALAREEGASCLVVMTQCADPELHRDRIAGRRSGIPGWYELDWEHVARARGEWEPLGDVDLKLGAAVPVAGNAGSLRHALSGWRQLEAGAGQQQAGH